jgi:hypothetical protein
MPTSVFLSCVSEELRAYRHRLAQELLKIEATVYTQESFQNRGDLLFDTLDRYIRQSNYVVHLIGDARGQEPGRSVVGNVLGSKSYDGLADCLKRAEVDPYRLSYTQWEYWLGVFHQRRCLVYLLCKDREPADPTQLQHLKWIRARGPLRARPENEWHLVALVMSSLLNLSGRPAPGQIAPAAAPPVPVLVLALHTSTDGYRLEGALRVGSGCWRLGSPVPVDVRRAAELTGAFSDVIHRGRAVLAEEKASSSEVEPEVELALPAELLFRPSTDWRWYPKGGRSGAGAPIREWFVFRLRLAGRPSTGPAVRTLERRLALLADNHGLLAAVYPVDQLRPPNGGPPFAVVHDHPANQDWWQYEQAVCGGFTDPPAPRPSWGSLFRRSQPVPPIRAAVERGVPYLVWPEGPAVGTAALVGYLGAFRPGELCTALKAFNAPRYAVLADAPGGLLPDDLPLVSDVTPREELR